MSFAAACLRFQEGSIRAISFRSHVDSCEDLEYSKMMNLSTKTQIVVLFRLLSPLSFGCIPCGVARWVPCRSAASL